MALLGKIEQFDSEQEEFAQYVERVEQFFIANEIEGEAKKRATFLSVIGPEPYKLLRSLLFPTKPTAKTFEQLVTVLKNHYQPPPSEVMQRFRFNSRSRKPGESVAAYVAELRRLAEGCKYGDTLDVMLRDRLVWGINDDGIQKKLLQEPELTYQRAVALAQGAETAERNLKEMKTPGRELDTSTSVRGIKSEPVNKVSGRPKQPGPPPKDSGVKCHCCGMAGHLASACRHRERTCYKCKKKGHLASVCRSKRVHPPSQGQGGKAGRRPVRHVDVDVESEEDESDSDPEFVKAIFTLGQGGRNPAIKVNMTIDKCTVPMEVDTGASVTIMGETTFHRLWPGRSLSTSHILLQTYSKEPIEVVGSAIAQVGYQGQTAQLSLLVVKGDGPTLLGRNWLSQIRLNWNLIHQTLSPGLHDILEKYQEVFEEGLGTFREYEARIKVNGDAVPRFCKARTVPYAMRQLVEEELDRLVAEGTLEPVDHSEWAAPIVPVLKSDRKSVRICGDFRMTVNPVSKLNRYPIPKVEDVFATLERGKEFTKLDLAQAYLQLRLDEESRKYVVINTQKGLFRYTRLPYGVSSAPGIFQKAMETLLRGIPCVSIYLDDILISGETEPDHLHNLEEVLKRLAKAGLRAKKSKCKFMAPSVTYLGHVIDEKGLHPMPDKVKAVQDAPTPQNVAELKSYLGLLTYYGKFLPNLSTELAPLYTLLGKGVRWKWRVEHDRAFQKSKDLLTSSQLLVHFNPKLPLLLACDASAYGVGAVLAHRMPDGSEKPIGYASRTLNSAERNYSQLEKEGLSCIFGIKKFYAYLFGHAFKLITDHKPLLGLLGEQKPISSQASARIRRWALYLSMFEYTLQFRNTTAHANADALSRLPLPVKPAIASPPPELVLLTDHLDNSPVTAHQIKEYTRRDSQLAPVLQFVQQGWPDSCPDSELSTFFNKRTELSVHDGCLLWGTRVIVPSVCRETVLMELHEGHPGASRMKALARMYVWWPGITQDVEEAVRGCSECQLHQSSPPASPLHPWEWPTRPWARLHLDYAGPIQGKMVLILVDAHSKWVEAICTPNATSATVVEELRTQFSLFGIPETIVTDNGPCFVGEEFEAFLRSNGVNHITSAPYHPASNGLAERAVQTVKRGLKKVTKGSFRSRLARVLFAYRLTPQTTTGVSPSELLLGRRPMSRLDLLKPNTARRVEQKQAVQKRIHDSRARVRDLQVGEKVFVRNYHHGDTWLPGEIERKTGPVSVLVRLNDGRERRCHFDQVRSRSVDVPPQVPAGDSKSYVPPVDIPVTAVPSTEPVGSSTEPTEPPADLPDPVVVSREKTYPRRARRPVDRFQPEW